MNTATFDGQNILGSPLVVRSIKHESSPERQINVIQLSREDGGIISSSRYASKRILIEGILTESVSGDLEEQIDILKELFSRQAKELIVSWDDTTRVYVATCVSHEFDRDHYHISHVPFRAEFIVPSGEGKSEDYEFIDYGGSILDTYVPAAFVIPLLGTKSPKPIITITGQLFPAGCKGISLTNDDTDETVVVTHSADWGNSTVVEVDCENKTINHTISSVDYPLDFFGLFPRFKIGDNNFTLACGGIVNQRTLETVPALGGAFEYRTGDPQQILAQSFSVPYSNDTFQGITIALKKYGSPGNVTVSIETDSGGNPSGSVVASGTITASDVGTTSVLYYTAWPASIFSLTANVRYWITIKVATTSAINNFYYIGQTNNAAEDGTGIAKVSSNGGSTWSTGGVTRSRAFRVLYGGKSGVTEGNFHSGVTMTIEYKKTYL